MRIFFTLFLCLSSFYSRAVVDYANRRIDKNLYEGEFLIYNCEKRHYACVLKEFAEACKINRNNAIARKESFLPCAPLDKFESVSECYKKGVDYRVYNLIRKDFCRNTLQKIF